MSQDLIVYDPIEIPSMKKGTLKSICAQDAKDFWQKSEARKIANKQGCYVFALRSSRGFTAWYVGKAAVSFEQECLTPGKLQRYNEVLFKGIKGTPVLFIIALDGDKKKVPKAVCDEIETFLIQRAYKANPDIMNCQKKREKPSLWTIAGVIGDAKAIMKIDSIVSSSQATIPEQAGIFRKMMQI